MSSARDRTWWAVSAATLAFALLAAAVALRGTGAFDAWAAEAVRRAASPAADVVARAATALASGPVTLAAVLAAAAGALAAGETRTAAILGVSWAASGLGAGLLK